jgi:hypothetical protein
MFAIQKLIEKGLAQQSEAYKALGAEPGPGIDLLIRPVEPLCGKWFCDGLTVAGKRFVQKFYMEQPFNNYILARLKREAEDWALKYRVDLAILSLSQEANDATST